MERIIAIKRSRDIFEFYKIQIPPYIILAHELLHYLFRLKNYNCGIDEEKFKEKIFLNSIDVQTLNSNTVLLFGDTRTAIKKAYDD